MFGAILAILATAIGFTAWCIQAQIPMVILDAMEGLITSQFMFLLVLNLFLLVVGMLMDIFSAIVVVVPLIIPIANHFGVNPYHLGIVFLLNLEIGYLTPPVGLNLFISAFRFGKPMALVYRAVLPFIAILIASLIVTTYVPSLSTGMTSLITVDEIDMNGEIAPDTGDGTEPSGELPAVEDDLGLGLDDLDLDDLGAEEDAGTGEVAPPSDDDITLDDLEGADPLLEPPPAPTTAEPTMATAPTNPDEVTLDDLEAEQTP
jgi:hypothetical protein